jgi:transcription-repair coupling factor (superfamily II helicase)
MNNQFIRQIKSSQSCSIICPTDGSHKPYLISQLFKESDRSVVVVVDNSKAAQDFLADAAFFLPGMEDQLILFPGYHILPFKSLSYHRDTSTRRLAVLSRILDTSAPPVLVVIVVDTLLHKLLPKRILNEYAELLMANEEVDRDALIAKLESAGYIRTSLVEDPGDYSVRGGILDLFVPGESQPFRIEFFADTVESIRYFSPYTQRGTKEVFEAVIIPATETIITPENQPHVLGRLRKAAGEAGIDAARTREYVNQVRRFGRFDGIESMLSIIYEAPDTFFDYVPEDTLWVLDDPGRLEACAADTEQKAKLNFKSTVSENRLCVSPATLNIGWQDVMETVLSKPHLSLIPFGQADARLGSEGQACSFAYQDNSALSAQLKRGSEKQYPLEPFVGWMKHHIEQQRPVICTISQETQTKRFNALLQPYGIVPKPLASFNEVKKLSPQVYYILGQLNTGFVLDDPPVALVTENEIFAKKRIRRRKSGGREYQTEFIAPEELKNGDFVVHIDHGVGQYQGLCSLKVNRITQDFILILYQDDDKLYLPVDRIEMIGKYIGVDGYTPVLDKIGSKAWSKSKIKAKQEVEKLAADLLDLYAKRRVQNGFSFSRPDNYYNDFEATFPYEETKDQLKAIDDVHLDMESATPMDRLVCGDVGYGKTEVAIRAAFKAVNDGKQVAVVVPTTILAEQHAQTFRERFENHPVNIACLSRFRSKKDQIAIVKELKSGMVDIAIGTHRLLQKDIHFKSLGLLVIDEEQRFGVKHKEALKHKRSSVDVLALTATPIPRTLHMSLTGMRDISVITTPPADRQPIVSYISQYDDSIIRDAVRKELDRKGQIFFVHNNIKTINKMAQHLGTLVPEARIGIAHGRLSENELEKVMMQFVGFEINLLVCTTIIESGLDIPSANTMIINKAERFGLSQIYQLRGRIGRGDHQAYAYLFISDESRLTKDAKKRLSALMEYRDLGSGFQIAMKDLQIRGAGTALGASQSGHIAAVGYDMFLKLLDQAIHDLKGENVIEPIEPEINAAMSTGFPEDYIESVEQRLTLYRRLSRISNISEISDFKKELTDRYGKLPQEAENMLIKIMLRVYCINAGIQRLDLNPTSLALTFSPEHRSAPMPQPGSQLLGRFNVEYVKKHSIKINLARKRTAISRALIETREILKQLVS